MGKNYLRIVWIVAFVAFAAVSCWATAESLHMLLSSWPLIMCWVVTVGFFIIASIGTKMIVDSLNQNIYLEKRSLYFSGGVLLVLVFWLICSMPTNTHTFFYRTVINDMVTTDVSATRGYLGQIKNNTNNVNLAEEQVNRLRNNVDIALGELESEIKNEANPGFGPKSEEILRKIAALLSVDKIEPLTYKGTSKQDREKLCDAYRTKIYILAENKANNIRSHILSPNPDDLAEVRAIDENLMRMREYIDDGTINLNKPEHMSGAGGVCDKLNEGYNAVKKDRDFVRFDSPADEDKYTAETPVTDVRRMLSVFNVWNGFIKGDYKGYGFVYWIIISILVDVAAFIFFDLAFKKTEY